MPNLLPKLDWVPRFDEKSREYPIRAALPETVVRRTKLWKPGPIIDQGREGACVGFGWTADALATPVRVNLANVKQDIPREPTAFAQYIYREAQRVDEWEGEQYNGTSVLAGAKVMQYLGLVREYRWAFSIEDVIDAIIRRGPVVLGIRWYSGMYSAPGGVLEVSGSVVGGHCLTAIGYNLSSKKLGTESIVLQNSWGYEWGINGLAEISVKSLAELLDNNGEACVPYRRSYGR